MMKMLFDVSDLIMTVFSFFSVKVVNYYTVIMNCFGMFLKKQLPFWEERYNLFRKRIHLNMSYEVEMILKYVNG